MEFVRILYFPVSVDTLLYVRLASLLYHIRAGPDHTRLVAGDALPSTARAVLICKAVVLILLIDCK